MKKIVLNISDATYEKLRFEAFLEKKSMHKMIQERVLHISFNPEVEEAFDHWINYELKKITEE